MLGKEKDSSFFPLQRKLLDKHCLKPDQSDWKKIDNGFTKEDEKCDLIYISVLENIQ